MTDPQPTYLFVNKMADERRPKTIEQWLEDCLDAIANPGQVSTLKDDLWI